MNNRPATLAALALLAVAVAACSAAPASTASPTASSSAPANVAIRTAPVANALCMDALLSGTLARHAQTGLGVTGADGQQMPVEWPFRYSARGLGGRLVLVDDTGKIVAREGDRIQVGGGFGNILWHACGPVTVAQGG